MNKAVVFSLGLSLAAAASCPVSAQPKQNECAARVAKANQDILAFYPAAAKAATIEGSATINCQITPHGARRDCTLVSENPAGEGFGKAALDVAAATTDTPTVNFTPEQAEPLKTTTLNFKLLPPRVVPNMLSFAIHKGNPKWARRPDADDLGRALRQASVREDLGGKATMSCIITKDGDLSACTVVSEDPTNSGFGLAALKLARYFKMSPMTDLGCPLEPEGAKITIPIRFGPQR
jgi:TonB family protein